MEEQINLVNQKGERIGTMTKMEAHQKGELHEAFSVLVFNGKGEMLLQRRALEKYHSAGLWSNTCCSHPRAGESLEEAVHRRLQEEMGFDCELQEQYAFIYKTGKMENDLVEHEYDHVFQGKVEDVEINPDPREVVEFKWMNLNELRNDASANPDNYTFWLKIILANWR